MKKITRNFFTFCFFVLLSSCNNEESMEFDLSENNLKEKQQLEQLAILSDQLTNYSQDFFIADYVSSPSRIIGGNSTPINNYRMIEEGSWSKVIATDWATGKHIYSRYKNFWGAVAGAAVASAAEYLIDKFFPAQHVYLNNPRNIYDVAGRAHNELMAHVVSNRHLYQGSNQLAFNEKVVQVLVNNYGAPESSVRTGINSLIYSGINKDIWFNYVNVINRHSTNQFDAELVNKLSDTFNTYNSSNTVNVTINEMIRTFTLNALNTGNIYNLDNYSIGYENIILDSELEESLKEFLLLSTSIGKNSMAIWKDEN